VQVFSTWTSKGIHDIVVIQDVAMTACASHTDNAMNG